MINANNLNECVQAVRLKKDVRSDVSEGAAAADIKDDFG